MKSMTIWVAAAAATGLLLGTAAVLLTPLRYTPLLEPSTEDIENAAFYPAFEADPEAYVFVDVRDRASYAEGHPKGAVNIPLASLYTERENLPKDGREIVLICGGNSASGVAYSYLEHFGFTNLKRIPGGYREWLVAGLPHATGTAPYGN